MQANTQAIEKIVRAYDGTVEVHSIFYTIQGEGPFAGTPAVFVRLAGCNLQCPMCDTEYTDKRIKMTPDAVLQVVQGLLPSDRHSSIRGFVVITGGEPFRQPITDLIGALADDGYYIQIESNGTIAPPADLHFNRSVSLRLGTFLVISPKAGKVNTAAAAQSCCFKYVQSVSDGVGEDGLPLKALGHTANPFLARPPVGYGRPIYLQPADEQDPEINAANMKAVVASCMKHGYVLQLQIHKLLGLE